jgi:small ligand-binding sensory domain FIST
MAYKRRQLAAAMSGPDASSSSSSSSSKGQAFGMLLFSCNGRGMNLYDEPSYDSRTLASYIPVPCGGFMCNGECNRLAGWGACGVP